MLLRVAVAALLLALLPSVACAEKRVGLIIGNGAYAKVGKLSNPARDAGAVEALLRAAGFDLVEVRNDLGALAMRRALRDFSDRVREADIAVVFYAGHGIEVNGTNYLIPVDAILERDIDVEDEAVPLERVTQILEQAKRLRLVILDACRDNPFVRSMKRTLTGRSIGRGLAKVDVLTSDTLIAFAAKAGSTAADGEGANSPYTTALVKHLTTPGLDLRLALGRVRDEVLKSTRNGQEPFVYGSLGGAEIPLVPMSKPEPQPAPRPQALSPSEAAEAWDRTKDNTNAAALEAFIARYKDTYYADLARLRIEELRQAEAAQQTAYAAKKRSEEEAHAKAEAERQRLAMLQQQEDEKTRADKARRAREAAKSAEEQRLASLKAIEKSRKATEEATAKAEAERQRLAMLQQQDNEKKRAEAKAAQEAAKEKSEEEARAKVAALPKIEKPAGAAQFDGHWTGTWTGDPGKMCNPPTHSVDWTIANGVVTNRRFSGRVSVTGAIGGITHAKDGAPVRYEGTLRGNSGSGRSYRTTDDKCTGRFTVRRS